MRLPAWFRTILEATARRALEGDLTEEQAVAELAKAITDRPDMSRDVATDFARRQLKAWAKQHLPRTEYAIPGQVDLFPGLPPALEISPGRFVAQAVMTGRDWDRALKQAETKAANTSGHLTRVQQAYDRVRPLLTRDDLTTADVLNPHGQQAIGGM